MATSRRLAAIFAADVAGYSRLMGADEEGTLGRLKSALGDIVDPTVGAHRGRIFKTTGDGLLAEFASVIDAVRCALAIQRAMGERLAATPADPRLEFRIGIHVGDVIVEADDLYGDGVNIAARLEALAAPGGICVSARVYEDTVGRVDGEFQDGGAQSLKNIERPIRVYRLRTGGGDDDRRVCAAESGLRHIGVLGVTMRPVMQEFRRALAAYGHIDGQTVRIHDRWCEGDYARYPELVRELIELPVELIVAVATPATLAAKQATGTIPIVMVEVGDPVAYGIVPSLMRPGGNVTGLSNNLYEYGPKCLRLLKEILPDATRVGIISPSTRMHSGIRMWTESMETVAHALDLISRCYYADTAEQARAVFTGLDSRTDVLVVGPDHGLLLIRSLIIATAMELRMPVICPLPEYVRDGALLSLDPDRRAVHRRLAYYVDAILKGAAPSALPIEEPTKDWLMLNLATARRLGIEIPGPILMRADEVIE